MNYDARTFYETSGGWFMSQSRGEFSCPPYIISSVALDRVTEGAELKFPEALGRSLLSKIMFDTGWGNKRVDIPGDQAEGLRQIGEQLLSLDAEGKIQPPLNQTENAAIRHLLRIVELANA